MILGVVAAVMSLRGEMRLLEKASWMLIIALLLVSEFAAIRKSDEQAASDRKKQDESFELVLKKEDESFKQTLQGFRDETTHATTILGTAQRVANIAKTNLENLTGGDSYAYMAPQFPTETGAVPLAIVNVGNYPLTGVTVVATDITELPFKTFPSIVVGTLSAHAVRRIDMFLAPNPEASKAPSVWLLSR